MSDEAVRIEWTAQKIFVQITRLFVLQGIIRGSLYGAGFGTVLGLISGLFGMMIGAPLGLGIGLTIGTVLGLIGGYALGAFSVRWGRRQGGVMSDQHTVNRDGYRREVIWISVGTVLFLGLLIVGTLIVTEWDVRSWRSIDPSWLAVVTVPVLIAGFASLQAAKKIIDWYETNVGLPRSVMVWDETPQEGVWPPPPIHPESSPPVSENT